MDATMGAAIVASVINSSSLNGRTNTSSSSSSSGYASGHSAASTPATPISSQYDTSTHATMPPVSSGSSVEQLPTATVAPVMPFYSETSLAQQQRQQYYPSYPYANSSTQYNPVYDAYTGNSYHNLTTPSVERSLTIGSAKHSSSSSNNINSPLSGSHQRAERQNKPLPAYSTSAIGSQHYGTSSTSASTVTTSTPTKPQATATPFFAQPSPNVNTTAATYYDTYGKYKMPSTTKLTGQTVTDYATNYTNHLQHAAAAAATLSYQEQQQHYYAAAKSQLQDVNYVAAVVKPHRQHSFSNSTAYYNSGSAYYDKYMYGPTANTAAYSAVPSHAPPQLSYPPHEPPSADPYRASRISAPWQIEYGGSSAGNCRNIQRAGNSSSYIAAPSASGNGRDSYCATAADKYSKYDKYGAYYGSPHHPQQYISPPSHSAISSPSTSARSLWSNTQHHSPHLAPIPAVLNERLPSSLSPSASAHQYPHAHTHANAHHPYGTATNTTTQRTQSCCTQPFQQQSCFYPRPTQQYPHVAVANAYQSTQAAQYGVTGSSAHKYPAYTGTYKPSNSNDLYLSSPFDPPPATYNYSGSTAASMAQRYAAMPATNSAYYNDLNVQPTFENYTRNTHSMSQPSVMSQHVGAAHPSTPYLSYQTHGTNQGSGGTAALLQYRKPLSTAAAAPSNDDFCMSSTHISLPNLDQHVVDTPSYLTFDIHGNPVPQTHSVITSPSIYSDVGNSNSEKSSPTTKNLSLRDFLATWNEEEEEDINSVSEQMSFIAKAAESSKYLPDNRSETAAVPITSVQPIQLHTQQSQANNSEQQFQQYKNSYQGLPKIHVGITVDGPMDVEASQYINLPDIVIDIEKSNTAGTAIAPTVSTGPGPGISTESTFDHHHSPCGHGHELFDNFDVEKELDELQIKRAKICLEKQLNNEIRILTPEPIESLSQELVQDVPPNDVAKHTEIELHDNTIAVQSTECENSYTNSDQFLKEIDFNDNNSHSSNSSTFEKEYETFINRIDIDKVCEQDESQKRKEPLIPTHHSSFINDCSESVSHQSSDIKTPPDPIMYDENAINDTTENQDFTMFYKKKRKLMKDENEEDIKNQSFLQIKPDIKAETESTTKNINAMPSFTTVALATKIALKKPNSKTRRMIPINFKKHPRSNFSQFYKILRRRRAAALVQKHIAMLKERHLPLIKRQSFKNYSSCDKVLFNPRSLMHLTISLVNSAAFQEQLLLTRHGNLKNCSEIDGEVHKDCLKVYTKDICNEMEDNNNSEHVEISQNSTAIVQDSNSEDDGSFDKNVDNLKGPLEEPDSNSDSVIGGASLKEQDDFNGFEEQKILENRPAEKNSQQYCESKNSENSGNGQQESDRIQNNISQSPMLETATTTLNQMASIKSITIDCMRRENILEEEKNRFE